MKKLIIYGIGEYGMNCLARINRYYSEDIEIIGFADSYKSIDGYEKIDIHTYQDKECSVVIAMRNLYTAVQIYGRLKSEGYGNVYAYSNKDNPLYSKQNFFEYECIKIAGNEDNMIPYIEMHIVDFCNLNCAGCTHFAPVYEKKIPNAELKLKDIEYLTRLSDEILRFDLMGGEPLLSPDLEKYVLQARKLLPYTEIELVTNGLLILRLPEEVLNCIKNNNIKVVISEYKPTHTIINEITQKLEEYEIDYTVRRYNKKAKFVKPLAQNKETKYPKKCISNGCVNISDGKIARCPTVMYIHKLNDTFGTNYPTEGAYELKDICTMTELKDLLKRKVPLCEYCIYSEMEWHQCKNGGAKLDDFVTLE